jgi:internalin A
MLRFRQSVAHLVRLFVVLAMFAIASCSNRPREVKNDFKGPVANIERPEDRVPRSIVRDDLAEGKPVVELTLGFKSTNAELKEVIKYESLHALSLENCDKVTAAGVPELAALRELRWLNLSRSGVTDAGLKEFAGVKGLRILDLAETSVTDDGLKALTSFKNLRDLYLGYVKAPEKVTEAGLKTLAKITSLKRLDLAGIKLTRTGLKNMAPLKGLQALGITVGGLRDGDLCVLTAFPNLQELVLANTELTDRALSELAALKNLQTLTLHNVKLPATGLQGLAAVKNLKELVLDNYFEPIAPASLRDLTAIKSLKMLCLISDQKDSLSDAWLKELAPLQGLQELRVNVWKASTGGSFIAEPERESNRGPRMRDPFKPRQGIFLVNSDLTNAGLTSCAALKGLQGLHVASNAITDAGLKELAPLQGLTQLTVRGNKVTNLGLKELGSLGGLRELSISWSNSTDAGLKDIARLTMLRTLDLSFTGVTDSGLAELKPLRDLRELNLDDTPVTEAGLKMLRETHPECRVSHNLDFTNSTKFLREAYTMNGALDVAVQQQLKSLAMEQTVGSISVDWVRALKAILVAIVAVAGGAAALRNVGKPVTPTSMRPVFSLICIGSVTSCAGVGLFLFGMLAEDHPFLPVAGTGVVFLGLLISGLGLCRRA